MEDRVGSACGIQAICEVTNAYSNMCGVDCVDTKMDLEEIGWWIVYCLAEGRVQWWTVVGCAVHKRH
jgi:hypothetical protein